MADDYEQKPALQNAAFVGLQSAGVGLVVSSVQNALETHGKGAAGVLTRTGGTIGFFAAMGAVFSYTEASIANARAKNDAWNGAAGGCAAGFLAGVRARSIPTAVASCAIIGGFIGMFDLTGRSLTGGVQDFEGPEQREERRLAFFKKPRPLPTE
ncbi:hypothetical protein CALVIDRAFT_535469 [Calocera viscosa TUFC12733]|uniref:Uncharacterized protein n=1 Tax=Calocera viscosa (strain TUFC12733) TaxID=1330018 RepID=A0A167P3J5_CALVF|nr:hypothetical protein CALVIDRAFT_535469 [Calocera viscosa TUFC12733]